MRPNVYHPNQEQAFEKINAAEKAINELIEELKQHPEFNVNAFYTAGHQITTGFMWLKRGVDQFS